MDPRELLPPEIWELIFDKLEEEDPQDWLNLYRTSSAFQELMGERRQTALFPQVIPHVFAYLGSALIVSEILRLRLVCWPWKAAVDKTVVSSTVADSNNNDVIRQALLEHAYDLSSSARIRSFLEWFETHSGNPFVGRYAILFYDHSWLPQISKYSLLATRLLDKFGAQLKTVDIEVYNPNFMHNASRILDCVRRMPNLESLRVYCHILYSRVDDDGELRPNIEQGRLIPPLLNLKSITFTASIDADRRNILDLQNAVLRLCCNSSPNSLQRAKTIGFPSALQNFPHLKSARVSQLLEGECAELPLLSPPWPLSELVIMWNSCHEKSASLYKCIEHFKATLTTLHLQCRRLGPNDPLELKLDLPQLKRLRITMWEPSKHHLSLGYLTRLTNLEVLSFEYDPRVFKGMGAQVQEEVARWRLWEVLPKLRKICLIHIKLLGATQHDEILMASQSSREFQRKTTTTTTTQLQMNERTNEKATN